jgi:glucuronoarabinoxylan endo-1,4-beta-xylanase
MKRNHGTLTLLVIMILVALQAFAGVTVTENVGAGATSWPGTPVLKTVTNPASQLTVGESFSGATSYTETFTIPAPNNYTLQTIYLYVGAGNGTTSSNKITLNLFDLGKVTAPNPSSYSAGVNLLGDGNGLPITYTVQANGLMQLDFTGTDQVQLISGHLYAFELAAASGTTPIFWYRTVSDTYSGGAAYRSRAWINGGNARDFGLALYGPINTDPIPPTKSTINGAVLHQQIDGYGAGAVFLDAGLDPLQDSWMDSLYGTGANQMALTLIRLRIDPNGDWTNAILDGQKAKARGAKILATPWTPPASMKDNNDLNNGGALLPSQYPAWVDYLNRFTDAMDANGAPVDVVSIQNEPDFTATYESCRWTAAQFQTFFHNNAQGIKRPVMMPESFHFDQTLSDPTLNDSVAAANVAYIGGHLYGGTIADYPLAHSLGKHTWMTEYLLNDQTIASAVGTGQQISDSMTTGNYSGYIWWKTIGNANGLLDATGALQKRAYVMAQFSKFVRPGDTRVDVPLNTSPLGLSAYKDSASGRFAIVAVNNTSADITQTFSVGGVSVITLTPWITSASKSLEQQADVTIQNGAFTYTVPALSVVTFSGSETSVAGTVQLVTSATLTKQSNGSYKAVVKVKNSGTGSAENVVLNQATIGSASGTPVPQSLGNIAPGASNTVTVTFPASTGTSGTAVIEQYQGTYAGGSFATAVRGVLP